MIKGIELSVGDMVMVPNEESGRYRDDETLTNYVGQCSNGLHFRTKRGAHVCYDKCADLVIR